MTRREIGRIVRDTVLTVVGAFFLAVLLLLAVGGNMLTLADILEGTPLTVPLTLMTLVAVALFIALVRVSTTNVGLRRSIATLRRGSRDRAAARKRQHDRNLDAALTSQAAQHTQDRTALQSRIQELDAPVRAARTFLELHEEGGRVSANLALNLPWSKEELATARGAYRDWSERCSEAVREWRPDYAFRMSEALSSNKRAVSGPKIVELEDRYFNIEDTQVPREQVEEARKVLREIVESYRLG